MTKTTLFATLIFALIISACGAPATPTNEDVLAAFKTAGLEAESPTPMGPDDYGFGPFVCKGVRFLIPALGENKGGRVFICDNTEDRDKLAAYYENLGKESAAFFSWVFKKGSVLVQINGDLDEETAKKYEQAIP